MNAWDLLFRNSSVAQSIGFEAGKIQPLGSGQPEAPA
jgi:hypothetical protein